MDVHSEKSALRRLALSRRDALSARERAEANLEICRALASLDELRGANRVLAYFPVGSECSLTALYEALRARGVLLAFPVTARDGRMEACVPRAPLVPGPFGVPEPDPALSELIPPEDLDAVLVPCVGFDGDGGRLGHGGGYYDRYLPRCPLSAAILVAFEAQRLERVPREAHDLSFSLLVTERGVYRGGRADPISRSW